MLPVLEGAVVIATEYCKSCGRTVVMPEDIQYGLKYCSRNLLGRQVGTMFPEVYEDDSDDDSDDIVTDDSPDHVWTRYDGDDEKMLAVNECVDTWDSWEPVTPSEVAIKNAIDGVR